MKTLQSFNGGAGTAAVTTWNYDAYRGWLLAKDYANPTTGAAGTDGPNYSYSDGGRLTSRSWARGVTTVYDYKVTGTSTYSAGELRTVSYNDQTPATTYSYDRRGRMATALRDGITTTYTYNEANQPVGESHSGGALAGLSIARTYDASLRLATLDAVRSGSSIQLVGYTYDTAGRLDQVRDNNTTTHTARYTYESNSRLIRTVAFTNNASGRGMLTTRTWDRLNRLGSISSQPHVSTTNLGLGLGHTYTYNAANQRTRADLADGSYWVYEYDPLGQVKSAKRYLADGQVVAGQQFEYSYDDIGNRTSGKTGGDTAGDNLRTTTDTTDAEGRLSQRTNPRQYEMQGAAQVGTDVRVNGVVATRQGEYFRLEGTAAVATAQWLDQSVTLNGAAQISGRKKYVPPQTEAMLHDVAGNRTQDGRWEMRWDNENRLVDVWTLPAAVTAGVPNQRLRYTYDADGRLIERRRFSWVSGEWSLAETTRYLNDGLQCVAEYNGSNGLLRRQVWGLDLDGSRGGLGGIGGLLWIVSTTNGTHYAAPDGSGNVVALFGTSGTETARYEYGPFGEVLRMSGTPIAAENPWRFSSKRQDPTTDWVHYEFRVYDPSSGRWLSRDPIGEAGGENLYGFVGNNPLGAVDALGLAAISYLAGWGWSGEEADEYETSIGEFCLAAWEGIKCTAEQVVKDPLGVREKVIEGMSDRYATVIDLYGEWAVWAFVVNDVTGATTLVEGVSGIDLMTQEYLTEEERTERKLTGGGQVLWTITGPLALCERAAAKKTVTLYRGVNESHAAFEGAQQGLVRANGGLATPFEHNTVPGATLRSPYTSWTPDYAVAENFALRPNGCGVVIRAEVPVSQTVVSPNLKSVVLKQSGQIVSESEVLVRGTVKGTPKRVPRL